MDGKTVVKSGSADGTGDSAANCPKRVSFEDALTLAKFGRFNYALIAIAGTVLAAVMLEMLSISYVIAVAECDLELTSGQKGILGAMALAGTIAGSHLWGFLADTLGRRKVIIPTLLMTNAVSFASSMMTNFWMITICRFLTGFFICGASASIYAYLGEFHNQRDRSRAIMAASFVHSIGCPLLPGLAYVIINQSWAFTIPVLDIVYRPWRLFLVICGLPGFISALALLKFPESPKFDLNQGNAKRATETIQWIHRFNNGNAESPLQIQLILGEAEVQPSRDHSKGVKAVLELIWNQTAPLFKRPYLHKTILMCFLQFGTYITAHGMFMFFPGLLDQLVKAQEAGIDRITLCDIVYAHNPLEASGQSTCTQSLSLATYGYSITLDIIYVLGFLVIGLLVNAVGRLAILVFVFTGCGACGVLAILVDIPLLSMWLYIMMMMSGFTVSVVSAVTVDLFPTSLRAMAVGISLMCGRIGGVFGTNLAGLLLDSQCELTFGITCSILLLCSVLSFFIPNINKKVQPESS
ncbi:hypothetical protein quinque_001469 [Culex quinquefasciatus]